MSLLNMLSWQSILGTIISSPSVKDLTKVVLEKIAPQVSIMMSNNIPGINILQHMIESFQLGDIYFFLTDILPAALASIMGKLLNLENENLAVYLKNLMMEIVNLVGSAIDSVTELFFSPKVRIYTGIGYLRRMAAVTQKPSLDESKLKKNTPPGTGVPTSEKTTIEPSTQKPLVLDSYEIYYDSHMPSSLESTSFEDKKPVLPHFWVGKKLAKIPLKGTDYVISGPSVSSASSEQASESDDNAVDDPGVSSTKEAPKKALTIGHGPAMINHLPKPKENPRRGFDDSLHHIWYFGKDE